MGKGTVLTLSELEDLVRAFKNPKPKDPGSHVWQRLSRSVVDSNLKLLAVCPTPELARVMASSQRALSILGGMIETYAETNGRAYIHTLHRESFWDDVAETLLHAGKGDAAVCARALELARAADAGEPTPVGRNFGPELDEVERIFAKFLLRLTPAQQEFMAGYVEGMLATQTLEPEPPAEVITTRDGVNMARLREIAEQMGYTLVEAPEPEGERARLMAHLAEIAPEVQHVPIRMTKRSEPAEPEP